MIASPIEWCHVCFEAVAFRGCTGRVTTIKHVCKGRRMPKTPDTVEPEGGPAVEWLATHQYADIKLDACIRAVLADRERLQSELAEIRESYRKSIESPCSDERHCPCVPALRAELAAARAVSDARGVRLDEVERLKGNAERELAAARREKDDLDEARMSEISGLQARLAAANKEIERLKGLFISTCESRDAWIRQCDAANERAEKADADLLHYARCGVHAPECKRCFAIWNGREALRSTPACNVKHFDPRLSCNEDPTCMSTPPAQEPKPASILASKPVNRQNSDELQEPKLYHDGDCSSYCSEECLACKAQEPKPLPLGHEFQKHWPAGDHCICPGACHYPSCVYVESAHRPSEEGR